MNLGRQSIYNNLPHCFTLAFSLALAKARVLNISDKNPIFRPPKVELLAEIAGQVECRGGARAAPSWKYTGNLLPRM